MNWAKEMRETKRGREVRVASSWMHACHVNINEICHVQNIYTYTLAHTAQSYGMLCWSICSKIAFDPAFWLSECSCAHNMHNLRTITIIDILNNAIVVKLERNSAICSKYSIIIILFVLEWQPRVAVTPLWLLAVLHCPSIFIIHTYTNTRNTISKHSKQVVLTC